MRLQQLALRVDGDEHRLRFHDRLTVITGVDVDDRQGVVEVILGALAGEATFPSQLLFVDRSGRKIVVDQPGDGSIDAAHDDDGPEVKPWEVLGMSVHELFALTYVDDALLGISESGRSEPRELTEARAALAELTDQLEAAQIARDAANALRIELIGLDEELRNIDKNRAKRRYARLLLELEGLRAERAAQRSSPAEAQADRVTAAHLALLRPIAERWRVAAKRVTEAQRRFGGDVRLDAHGLAGALLLPDRVPPRLDRLVENLEKAESQRVALAARLAGLMAPHVAGPTHPGVPRLARADQRVLWQLARRAIATGEHLERESLAVGGLVAEGLAPPIVQEIESAHTAVEEAHETIEKRRFGAMAAGGAAALSALALPLAPVIAPLALAGAASAAYWAVLAPRQQLAQAQVWEEDILVRAGVPSYLAFHLRRMEAMQDPALRAPLERATTEHRRAMQEWRRVAGEISPVEAVSLETEVRNYAASVAALDELGDDVEEARRRLIEEVEPAVERAREALMEVCRPFGIEQPTLAADLVRQLAEVAQRARAQQALEALEAEERELRSSLEEVFAELNITEGSLSSRLAAFEERAATAQQRVRAREHPRSARELDREIERLEAMSRTDYRPEFGSTFTAADAREPDPDELQMRRDLTANAFNTAVRLVPDVEKLADRKSAVDRRVAILERQHGEAGGLPPTKVAEIDRYLADRLAALRHCGPAGESLPMLMDECFLHLRPDVKWSMLDLVDRLSGQAQVIYLTEDPEVATWAHRRSRAGTVGYLAPVSQPA